MTALTLAKAENIIKNEAKHDPTNINIDTIVSNFKRELKFIRKDISVVLQAPHTAASKKKLKSAVAHQRTFMRRIITNVLYPLWRKRQYATLAAITSTGVVGAYFSAVVVLMQLGTVLYIYGRAAWRVVDVIAFKWSLALMRLLRKIMQIPFDIPASLVNLVRHDSPELSPAQQKNFIRNIEKNMITA